MTFGDAAEPHAHINDFRMDVGDSLLMLRPSVHLFRCGFIEYDSKLSIAGPVPLVVLSGGMVGLVFAMIAVLTLLGIAFLEVFLVLGVTVWRDAKVRRDSNEPAQAGGL
jgi:hypothetical protein